MRIYAPVRDFNGVRNSVRFVEGIGDTDDPRVAEWFRSRGYKVEAVNNVVETVEKTIGNPRLDDPEFVNINELINDEDCEYNENNESCENDKNNEPDFEKMTPNEIRDWARENGFGREIRNIRSKEKLLEIVRG